jgi:hypothetical protein
MISIHYFSGPHVSGRGFAPGPLRRFGLARYGPSSSSKPVTAAPIPDTMSLLVWHGRSGPWGVEQVYGFGGV